MTKLYMPNALPVTDEKFLTMYCGSNSPMYLTSPRLQAQASALKSYLEEAYREELPCLVVTKDLLDRFSVLDMDELRQRYEEEIAEYMTSLPPERAFSDVTDAHIIAYLDNREDTHFVWADTDTLICIEDEDTTLVERDLVEFPTDAAIGDGVTGFVCDYSGTDVVNLPEKTLIHLEDVPTDELSPYAWQTVDAEIRIRLLEAMAEKYAVPSVPDSFTVYMLDNRTGALVRHLSTSELQRIIEPTCTGQ